LLAVAETMVKFFAPVSVEASTVRVWLLLVSLSLAVAETMVKFFAPVSVEASTVRVWLL